MSATVSDIAALISGKVIGDGSAIVSGTSNLKYANLGHITFVDNPKYEKQFIDSKALVTICKNIKVGDRVVSHSNMSCRVCKENNPSWSCRCWFYRCGTRKGVRADTGNQAGGGG